ncbi:MAG: hypothetical protein QNJ47_24450 [Nostocaceae cyanobacterium]|nr:hypothetical protein [Nostocaceae cyanobacterium]
MSMIVNSFCKLFFEIFVIASQPVKSTTNKSSEQLQVDRHIIQLEVIVEFDSLQVFSNLSTWLIAPQNRKQNGTTYLYDLQL